MDCLLAPFKTYLTVTKKLTPVTIKNYLSDLRHFLVWLEQNTPSNTKKVFVALPEMPNGKNGKCEMLNITSFTLLDYKNYLFAQKAAKSSINRRLAALRVFCQFCSDRGLLEQNPASDLANLSVERSEEQKINDLVSGFGTWLKKNHASRNTIKNYTADIKKYLATMTNNQSPRYKQ